VNDLEHEKHMFASTCVLRERGGDSLDSMIRLTIYSREMSENTATPSSLVKQQTVDYSTTTNEVACNRIYPPSLCEMQTCVRSALCD